MGKKIAKKLSFFHACYICILAAFRPSLLEQIEKQDNEEIRTAPEDNEPRLRTLNRSLWSSAGLILLFGAIGVGTGSLLRCVVGAPSSQTSTILQIFGALLLLWGTLFVRGFEVQSFSCVTLTERVNQWLYRGLYCIGTALVICSMAWGNAW